MRDQSTGPHTDGGDGIIRTQGPTTSLPVLAHNPLGTVVPWSLPSHGPRGHGAADPRRPSVCGAATTTDRQRSPVRQPRRTGSALGSGPLRPVPHADCQAPTWHHHLRPASGPWPSPPQEAAGLRTAIWDLRVSSVVIRAPPPPPPQHSPSTRPQRAEARGQQEREQTDVPLGDRDRPRTPGLLHKSSRPVTWQVCKAVSMGFVLCCARPLDGPGICKQSPRHSDAPCGGVRPYAFDPHVRGPRASPWDMH